MSEVRVVELKELGVSKEVFDKIYSKGEQDGRADAIDESINILKGLDAQIAEIFENIVKNAEHYKEQE